MRKSLILLLVALIFSACTQPKQSIWFTGSFDEAKTMAQSSDKKILIDFFSDT